MTGVAARWRSVPTDRPSWADKAIQSFTQSPSSMKHSGLYGGNRKYHDLRSLFSRALAQFTQLDCFSRSWRELIYGLGENPLPLLFCKELFGIQGLVFDV